MKTVAFACFVILSGAAATGCSAEFPGAFFDIDGTWLLEYSNSPNPTCLTFTNGKVTSELAGCIEPVLIGNASAADIEGDTVSFSYTSQQTILLPDGTFIEGGGLLTLEGTIQDDGSIAGSMRAVGSINGIAFDNTVGFIMTRL